MATVYEQRRARLAQILKKRDIDMFFVSDPVNVGYLCGFTGGDSFLMVGRDAAAMLLTDGRFETFLKEEIPDLAIYVRKTSEPFSRALAKASKEFFPSKESGSYAVESGTISLRMFELVESVLDRTAVPVCGAIEALRMKKDRTEITAIRRSARAAIEGFGAIKAGLQKEWSEIDLRNELDYQMRRAGADDVSFPTIVAVGSRAALPHAEPTCKLIGEGESVLIDWGAKYRGYASDLTRVLMTRKKISKKLTDIYQTVLKAQQRAIQTIRPGITAGEVDRAARQVIEEAGYGRCFNHGLGHGLGLAIHDAGAFSVGNDLQLRPGMVMTVEPGIYLPGRLGVRIEDDVLITPGGAEVLTRSLGSSLEEMFVPLP